MNNIIFKDYITRKEIKKNRHSHMYIFGDNLMKVGYGGQAREMRGECNTIGIPTKKSPSQYLRDKDYDEVVPIILLKFDMIETFIQDGFIIVIPSAGIGTGRADLSNKAPKIWKVVKENLEKLGWKNA